MSHEPERAQNENFNFGVNCGNMSMRHGVEVMIGRVVGRDVLETEILREKPKERDNTVSHGCGRGDAVRRRGIKTGI